MIREGEVRIPSGCAICRRVNVPEVTAPPSTSHTEGAACSIDFSSLVLIYHAAPPKRAARIVRIMRFFTSSPMSI